MRAPFDTTIQIGNLRGRHKPLQPPERNKQTALIVATDFALVDLLGVHQCLCAIPIHGLACQIETDDSIAIACLRMHDVHPDIVSHLNLGNDLRPQSIQITARHYAVSFSPNVHNDCIFVNANDCALPNVPPAWRTVIKLLAHQLRH